MRHIAVLVSLLLVSCAAPIAVPTGTPVPPAKAVEPSPVVFVSTATATLVMRIPVKMIPLEVVRAPDGSGVNAEVYVFEKEVGLILAVTVNSGDRAWPSRELWRQVSAVGHAALEVNRRGASVDRLFVVLETATGSIAGEVDVATLEGWEQHQIDDDQLFAAFDLLSLPPDQPAQVANPPVSCPDGCIEHKLGCDIKGNVSFGSGEKIYHVPGGEFYDQATIDPRYGERWFCTEQEAVANGWRRSDQ